MEELYEKQFRLRSSLYELIASCLYAEPSQDTLRGLARHKPYLEDLLTHWHEPKLQASVFRFLNAPGQSNANDLAIDYTRLFWGAHEPRSALRNQATSKTGCLESPR